MKTEKEAHANNSQGPAQANSVGKGILATEVNRRRCDQAQCGQTRRRSGVEQLGVRESGLAYQTLMKYLIPVLGYKLLDCLELGAAANLMRSAVRPVTDL